MQNHACTNEEKASCTMCFMNQKRWHKIEAILDQALSLENQGQREIYVKRVCNNDKQLYQEVISLLQSIRNAREEGFLE